MIERNFTRSRWVPLALFLVAFAVYLFSSGPALAPYRDMGEMVSVSHTLGVAHPPGYPAYTLIGKIFSLFPLANVSYRVNLASVLGGALACAIFFMLMLRLGVSFVPSLFAALLWLAASGFWIIAIVTEMYSLNLAAALLLLYSWSGDRVRPRPRTIIVIAFLSALFMGLRLDLVLLGPALLFWTISGLRRRLRSADIARVMAVASVFFVLGFSIYLYLMVRSNQKPYLNWNRPARFEKLWSSLTRKTHGGTLDLLSVNYKPGELFAKDMGIYFRDVGRQTRWLGLALAAMGLLFLYRRNRNVLWFTVIAWLFSGPFFIYKANMPPNPHALAVLEAHFNLANIFILVWIAFGLEWIFSSERWKSGIPPAIQKAGLAVCLFAMLGNLVMRWQEVSKRHNYFGYDYGKNILRSLPRESILIMKEDVQLFAFWALQYTQGLRPDVAVVARGLAGSPWYIQMMSEYGLPVRLGPLRSEDDVARFLMENSGKKVFAGWDHDVPFSSQYTQVPWGLVRLISPGSLEMPRTMLGVPDFLSDFCVYRGDYRYLRQTDFFRADLIDDYSKARLARGVEFSKSPEMSGKARKEFTASLALNSENPGSYYRRAFTYFVRDEFSKAARDFRYAEKFYEKTDRQTREFNSLPDVVESVRSEWADSLVNLGVALEKLGKKDESEQAYLKAIGIRPDLARAHFNIAVLYWNRDWAKVVSHLEAVMRQKPDYPGARDFLSKARYALKMSGQKR